MLEKLWSFVLITNRLCYGDRSKKWLWCYWLGFSDPDFQSSFFCLKRAMLIRTFVLLRCEQGKCCAVKAWEWNNIVLPMLISCCSFRSEDVMQKKIRIRIYIINDMRSQYSVWFRKVGSSCRYNERQLIDVTVVRRVRPRAEYSCTNEQTNSDTAVSWAERRYYAYHHPLTNKQIAIQLYY